MASNKWVKLKANPYLSVYPTETNLTIQSTTDVLSINGESGYTYSFNQVVIEVSTPNGVVSVPQNINGEGTQDIILVAGSYKINYYGEIQRRDVVNGLPLGTDTYSLSFYFSVVENKLPLKKLTITDVINRLLDVAEPIRQGDNPRFRLNAQQAAQFDKILAPEFSFTKQTLRECLQQIGGVVHGEPRLTPVKDQNGVWIFEVSYDMFASNESSNVQYMAYTDRGQQHVIESYLGGLDSTAENLINQLDKFSGVVVEPYAGGAKSVRTENLYVRIEEDNMLIPTQYPIYTIEKLEYINGVGLVNKKVAIKAESFSNGTVFLGSNNISPYETSKSYIVIIDGTEYSLRLYSEADGGDDNYYFEITGLPNFSGITTVYVLSDETEAQLQSVDITQYVFEKSEYDGRLSSYDGAYPYSKMYALFFTQGGKNIAGLNFKAPAASSASGAFKEYAITNILREATGNNGLTLDYPTMCFRVTYTPFYNARVGQTKANYKDFKRPAALIYNQQSNVIESRAYGENLKGAAARLGNTEVSLTYDLRTLNEIAIAGLKYNEDYYISAVATEIYPTLIKSTLGLSKDFNRISQYIGVSSVKRYYEVSRTQAVERNTLYREYVVIGNQETPDGDTLTGSKMLELIAGLFSPPLTPIGPVTNVVAWGTSYQGDTNTAVNLPVISSAFGNSISFSWTYEDNYSAGAFAQYQNNLNVSGYFQQSLTYGDYYGRLYYYNFDLQLAGQTPTADNYAQLAQALPKGSIPSASSNIVSTIGKTPYIMRKDNREALQVNFQLDFVTNLENMIIGSALASYCPAVRGTDLSLRPRLYVLPNELNKFTDHVEAFQNVNLNTLPSVPVNVSVQNGYLVINAGALPASGKAWAIVTAQTTKSETVESEEGEQTTQTTCFGGDLLIGQNIEVVSGQAFAPIYFTLKREIFDKSVWKDIL